MAGGETGHSFQRDLGLQTERDFFSSIWESFTAVRQESFLEPRVRSDEILRHGVDSWRTGFD